MLQQNQQTQTEPMSGLAPNMQFGGHELMEAKESIGGVVGALEHYALSEEQVQDQALLTIMKSQRAFLSQMYNTILDTLKSGQDPAVKTQVYEMSGGNQSTFGMTPQAPKIPIQSASELNDECISSAILGHLKGIATHFTTTALESSNPVLRRVFQDSIPNVIEMAFEMFIYMNKHQYYQVPQLPKQDMQTIINSFSPVPGNISH